MQTKYTYKGITWVDLEGPKKEEILELISTYSIHPLVAEELLNPSRRSKVDLYPGCIYLILHFPVFNQNTGLVEQNEIDFVVGKDFIVSVHYETVDPIHTFSKMFEVNSVLDKSKIGTHAGFVLFYMLRDLYRNMTYDLDPIESEISDIEQMVFDNQEQEMVYAISNTNRRLIDMRKSIRYHGKTLEALEEAGKQLFGTDFGYYLHSLTGEYHRISDIIRGYKDTLDDLRETNNSLLTTKTNNIIKSITIMAFTTIPINIATSFLSMNTNVPWLKNITAGPLLIVIGITALVSVTMYSFFRYKKWL